MLDDTVRIQLAMDAEDLRHDTDRVLAQLQDNRCEGAINWADLSCYTAIVGVDDEGSIRHEVRITEASPDNGEFHAAVQNGLKAFGWQDADVITVW